MGPLVVCGLPADCGGLRCGSVAGRHHGITAGPRTIIPAPSRRMAVTGESIDWSSSILGGSYCPTGAAPLELDTMEEDDRLKARAYLLHVYGVAVGCVPSERRLEELDTWAQDRNALAAASGHLLALARWVTDSWREHDSEEDEGMVALTEAHAAALLEVAHRG